MNAEIGIIGGTGFYHFFTGAQDIDVETPYGIPSASVSIATVDGRSVAFIPRHGREHQFLPPAVPYMANLWALRSLGVRQVIGFNTVGSLQPDVRRGDFVFCDQFIDRTNGRADSIFTGSDGAHISTAHPYCPSMRDAATKAVGVLPQRFHHRGTVVVIQGPRFSTYAESKWYTSMGWDVINMTQYPEVALAREFEMCYMNLSYVTDYDVAAKEIVVDETADAVSHALVIREFSLNGANIEQVIKTLVGAIPATDGCSCRTALTNARVAR